MSSHWGKVDIRAGILEAHNIGKLTIAKTTADKTHGSELYALKRAVGEIAFGKGNSIETAVFEGAGCKIAAD